MAEMHLSNKLLKKCSIIELRELCNVKGLECKGKTKAQIVDMLNVHENSVQRQAVSKRSASAKAKASGVNTSSGSVSAKLDVNDESDDDVLNDENEESGENEYVESELVNLEMERLKLERERLQFEREEAERRERIEMERLQIEKLKVESARYVVEPSSVSDGVGVTKHNDYTDMSKLLPKFNENQTQIDVFLSSFERLCKQIPIAENRWCARLAPLLSGKALEAYSRLSFEDSSNYSIVKRAILQRYDINAEYYRKRFRNCSKQVGESYAEHVYRMTSACKDWLVAREAWDNLEKCREEMLLEQYYSSLHEPIKILVASKHPVTVMDAARLADDYEMLKESNSKPIAVSKQTFNNPPKHFQSKFSNNTGRVQQYQQGKPKGGYTYNNQSNQVSRGQVPPGACYLCHGHGHIAKNCHKRTQSSTNHVRILNQVGNRIDEAPSDTFTGKLGGKPVNCLIDSGSSITIVRRKFIDEYQFIKNSTVEVCLANKKRVKWPLARVNIWSPWGEAEIVAAVSDDLQFDVIFGKNLINRFDVYSKRNVEAEQQVNVHDVSVVTRSQAKREREQVQEQTQQKVIEGNMEIEPGVGLSSVDEPSQGDEIQASQAGGSNSNVVVALENISRDRLIEMQHEDESLKQLWETAGESADLISQETGYLVQDGLLYRQWRSTLREQADLDPYLQIVLPVQCRTQVMALAHEQPLSGHLGPKKTRDRILANFFWPGMDKDIRAFCHSCDLCQRAGRRGDKTKYPLVTVPVVDSAFKKIAVDFLGPLVASESGNRYIMVICDYCTRYPEAIPMSSIESEKVAEELINFFSKVGFPEEIVHDGATNFVSKLMTELWERCGVKQCKYSPYHPMSNGLVERENSTLKHMLQTLVQDHQKIWDKYLPYLMFACREAVHESTGFSPFELVFGRQVRGPLHIIKEMWESPNNNSALPDNVIMYMQRLQNQLHDTIKLANENLAKSQLSKKIWYDRKARAREYTVGQQVLVLIPMKTSKLSAAWEGPGRIVRKVSDVNYVVELPGHRKSMRMYHVNMLKPYISREPMVNMVIINDTSNEESDEFISFSSILAGKQKYEQRCKNHALGIGFTRL